MTDLSDLRTSVNETARVARGSLLLLLVVSLYVATIVAGTDDLLLLKRGEFALPLMQVGVPVDLFYAAAPAVLLLLHVNLFPRLGQLSLRAGMLRARIEEFDRVELRKRETALMFPFEFLQLSMYRTSRGTAKPEPPIRRIRSRLAYEHGSCEPRRYRSDPPCGAKLHGPLPELGEGTPATGYPTCACATG